MKWLRRWLGLEDIFDLVIDIRRRQMNLEGKLDDFHTAIAQPIATLSSVLSDEFSDSRKAASDMIGSQALKRADAEAKARALTGGQDY